MYDTVSINQFSSLDLTKSSEAKTVPDKCKLIQIFDRIFIYKQIFIGIKIKIPLKILCIINL